MAAVCAGVRAFFTGSVRPLAARAGTAVVDFAGHGGTARTFALDVGRTAKAKPAAAATLGAGGLGVGVVGSKMARGGEEVAATTGEYAGSAYITDPYAMAPAMA